MLTADTIVARWAYVAATSLFALVTVVAPLRHHPRREPALFSATGGIVLLSALADIPGLSASITIGPARLSEALLLVASTTFAAWLIVIGRRTLTSPHRLPYLDVAATVLGVTLILWTSGLGALAGGADLNLGLLVASGPVVDVLLLALLTHLAVSTSRVSAPLRWLIGTATLMLLLDLCNVATTLIDGAPAMGRYGLHPLIGLGFAVAAAHPCLPDAWTPPLSTTPPPGHRRPVLLLLALLPIPLTAALPPHSAIDATVRGVIITALVGIIAARIWMTLSTLVDAEAGSRYAATHDELTGLYNRTGLCHALEARLRRDNRAGTSTAVLFLDLDRLKSVNDTYGHEAGDAVLRHAATQVTATLRNDDVVGRLSGDEFVVVVTVSTPADAEGVARRIVERCSEPLTIAPDHEHAVTPSIGIAIARPGCGLTPRTLVARADAAMYEAKRAGRGRWAFHA